MESTYFKRFRMEVDLRRDSPAVGPATLPPGYRFVPWNEALLDVHARTKFRSFRDEIDSVVFPCLGELDGCRRLMREIRNKRGFLPDATWLVAYGRGPEGMLWCGTIQTVVAAGGVGTIQNIGVVPSHRGLGLGTSLIRQAMAGLRCHAVVRGSLEVTAENSRAVRLYQRLGFRRSKTVYKTVDRSQAKAAANAAQQTAGAAVDAAALELAGLAEPAVL
jgi:ribosomal protein S18 acetylase RimI-like enzyme